MSNTKCIHVYGIVQGVGFRPYISRLANKYKLMGTVSNKGPYVEIYIQGAEDAMDAFQEDLEPCAPARAAILETDIEEVEHAAFHGFDIIESHREKGMIFVSPDIAICDKCKEELYNKSDRRYLHPFINCTACGPRLTILDSMPYDRERTSMGEFPMCEKCRYEYTHSETRRYDAQPVCCNECGPEVYILGSDVKGTEAISEARRTLANGGILAIKGIGGFHLACDARLEGTVSLLRKRKQRPMKPFAVMMKDMAVVKKECITSNKSEKMLDGHQKPIILLKKRRSSNLAPSVSPGNPKVGVMLPYAPLQLLLFDYPDGINVPDALVMTSGNPSGAPICRTDEDATEYLSGLADCIISHNRKIRLRADDSVMDWRDDAPYMIRRSRGFAPLPIMLKGFHGQLLALGGELKNSFCLAHDSLFYLSPYIGDCTDIRTMEALKESIVRMRELLEITPEAVICDMHPRYNTTALAKEFDIPTIKIQHHYAHIASCLAENGYTDAAIGVSFDGTGYGDDSTIWGGEFLLVKPSFSGYKRLGSIKPFWHAGGDAASREGWCIAVSMLYGINGHNKTLTGDIVKQLRLCSPQELKMQYLMADKRFNSIRSTSAGRLFDAISAVLGIKQSSTFEGEASMSLQFAAERYMEQCGIDLDDAASQIKRCPSLSTYDGRFILPTDILFSKVVEMKLDGYDSARAAFNFHVNLAAEIAAGCLQAGEDEGVKVCALSGGVFQNTLLTGLTARMLSNNGFLVLTHHLVPPNDGGIALGQATVGMSGLQ